MRWLAENWFMVVLLISALMVAGGYVVQFMSQPTSKQLETVRNWLLFAVTEAEKQFGSGTGALKLRAVYGEFCKVFPFLVSVIPFSFFSDMVDEVLVEMRNLLETNKDIKSYVEGK